MASLRGGSETTHIVIAAGAGVAIGAALVLAGSYALVPSLWRDRGKGARETCATINDDLAPSTASPPCSPCPRLNSEGAGCSSPSIVPLGRQQTDPYCTLKRSGYLSWDEYFMSVAFLSAMRSKDPRRQVGAVIVSSTNVILSIGYNGFPRGNSDDVLPWSKSHPDGNVLETKHPYVCHAEMNAIMNKNAASLEGGKMYVTLYPCNECAKLIIQAGIREIIFFAGKEGGKGAPGQSMWTYEASRRLLEMAGISVRRFCYQREIDLLLPPPGYRDS